MDLRTLRYFRVVAECGSYSRGAEMLRISQPAVSRAVRMLEAELGRELFHRKGHGVTLTTAGQRLLERSQTILRQGEDMTAEIRADEGQPAGSITIALPPAAGYFLAPAMADRMKAAFPRVSVRFVGGFSGYIHEWLVRGQVDLACLHDPLPQRGFSTQPLLREEVFVVGRPGFAGGAGDGPLPVRALLDLPLALPSGMNATRRLLDGWAAGNGIGFRPRIEVDDHTITRALIRRGAAVALLTRGAFADDQARGELEARALEPGLSWTLALVTCQRPAPPPLAGALATHLAEVARDLCRQGAWPATPLDDAGMAAAPDDLGQSTTIRSGG